MMEAVHTSDTSVYSNETTRRYIPEVSHLHARRRENLKCQKTKKVRRIYEKWNTINNEREQKENSKI
jgi:hypothetical protein